MFRVHLHANIYAPVVLINDNYRNYKKSTKLFLTKDKRYIFFYMHHAMLHANVTTDFGFELKIKLTKMIIVVSNAILPLDLLLYYPVRSKYTSNELISYICTFACYRYCEYLCATCLVASAASAASSPQVCVEDCSALDSAGRMIEGTSVKQPVARLG